MKLAVLASGKLREKYAKLACELYQPRIRRLSPFELIEIPEPKGADAEKSGARLVSRLKPGDRVVLLAPGGREYTSEAFARKLGEAQAAGRGRLVFVVGGPYGAGRDLEDRADEKMSLGKLTLPHELARVVLLEQIYRGLTILRGLPYHHG